MKGKLSLLAIGCLAFLIGNNPTKAQNQQWQSIPDNPNFSGTGYKKDQMSQILYHQDTPDKCKVSSQENLEKVWMPFINGVFEKARRLAEVDINNKVLAYLQSWGNRGCALAAGPTSIFVPNPAWPDKWTAGGSSTCPPTPIPPSGGGAYDWTHAIDGTYAAPLSGKGTRWFEHSAIPWYVWDPKTQSWYFTNQIAAIGKVDFSDQVSYIWHCPLP